MKLYHALPGMYLRNNYNEIPLLSVNINCQALYHHGDKQVTLIFQFLRAKIKQQIPIWAEAGSYFCDKQNGALVKSYYHLIKIQERLMVEGRIPRDFF